MLHISSAGIKHHTVARSTPSTLDCSRLRQGSMQGGRVILVTSKMNVDDAIFKICNIQYRHEKEGEMDKYLAWFNGYCTVQTALGARQQKQFY